MPRAKLGLPAFQPQDRRCETPTKKPAQQPKKTYSTYHDAVGAVVYQVERTDYYDGRKKTFFQRRPDPARPSEGRVRYETVEKTKEGLVPRLIEREGPTGLIVTTTSLRLHPENETRMLSLTITDTCEQTAAVFRALAQEAHRDEIDLTRWQALQTWIATGPNRVSIPFANRLAELVPPVAVRLRRDFKTVLMLIRANAMLHQASRRRDEDGRIIGQIQDYVVVRELIADLVAVGVDATVKPEVREVIRAVSALIEKGQQEVRQSELKSALQLDKSAISRRVADALDGGFLKNLEDRKGRPARLIIGEALPDNQEVLPPFEQLFGGAGLRSCTVDPGVKPPPPRPIESADVMAAQ
jgi:hypothetical protein